MTLLTDNLLDQEICPSCKAEYSGHYCPECGEKKLCREEMTLSYFFGSVWNALTFTDIKFIRSFLALLFKPGFLTLEYFRGRRKLYTRPLALFFFINLVYFLYQPVDALSSTYGSQVTGQFYSEWASDRVQLSMEELNLSKAQFESRYNKMTEQVSKLFLIVFIFIMALGTALINLNRQGLFFFHLVATTHFVSFSILTFFILLPNVVLGIRKLYLFMVEGSTLSFNYNAWYMTLPALILLWIYAFGMQRRLYAEGSIIHVLKASLLVLAFIITTLVYRLFLFVITTTLL